MAVSSKKLAVFLFFVALVSGFFWSHKMFGQPISGGGDEPTYNLLASETFSGFGRILDERARVPSEPFYPIFLAGVYSVFGLENFDAVRVVQIFLFAFTVLLIYFLAHNFFGEKKAFFVGLLMAAFFPLAGGTGYLLRELFFSFLLVLTVYLLYRAQKDLKLKWFILSGLVLGAAVLTNGVVQFFWVVAVLGFFAVFGKSFFQKNFLVKIGIFVLLSFMPATLWNLRGSEKDVTSPNVKAGYTLARRAEMMESIKGEKYFSHLGGQIFGYYFFEKDGFDETEFLGHPRLFQKIQEMSNAGLTGVQIGEILANESKSVILGNIPQYFAISVLDFLQFNGPMLPIPETLQAAPAQNLFTGGSHPGIPGWGKVIILLTLRVFYWLFFGFVIYGLAKAVKDWRKFCWIILIILYFNLVYSALFGIPRYSIPIYPFYITLFVYGAFNMFERLKLIYVRDSGQNKF